MANPSIESLAIAKVSGVRRRAAYRNRREATKPVLFNDFGYRRANHFPLVEPAFTINGVKDIRHIPIKTLPKSIIRNRRAQCGASAV